MASAHRKGIMKKDRDRDRCNNVTTKDENTDAIENVIQQLHDEDINVDQFVALVGIHTTDRGVALTQVMTEDLNSFRKMVDTVYETMTQDISDVLANEQMELAKMYEDKHKTIVEKIMENCKKLKAIYPPFNFEDYYDNPEYYVKKAFVIPEMPEDEEFDMVKRHLAFHRLQWIYSEGQRLKEENHKLQKKLTEMKRNQRHCLKDAVKREVEAEQIHMKLTAAERALQTKLAELNEKIQGSFVEDEKAVGRKKRNDIKHLGELKEKRKEKYRSERRDKNNGAVEETNTCKNKMKNSQQTEDALHKSLEFNKLIHLTDSDSQPDKSNVGNECSNKTKK